MPVRCDSVGQLSPQVVGPRADSEDAPERRLSSYTAEPQEVLAEGEGGTYVGESVGGVRHGEGKLTFCHDGTYVGFFKDGLYHGNGKRVYGTGNVYEGAFVEGLRCGEGKATMGDGETYVGGYKDGKKHGYGKTTYEDGNVYAGDYFEGKRQGQGHIIMNHGEEYKGGYKDGNKHGHGVSTYKDKEIYTGMYINGLRCGKGTNRDPKGNTYEGEWGNSLWNGNGTYKWVWLGDKYTGEFKDGKMHGQGTLVRSDGSTYTGEWENSKRSGRGRYTYKRDRPERQAHANDVYDGEWVDGAKEGNGEYTFGANGRVYSAGFVNNVPVDADLFQTTMDLQLPKDATNTDLNALFTKWGVPAAEVSQESCTKMQKLVSVAIMVGDRSLLDMLHRDFRVDMHMLWGDGSSAMDRALEARHAQVVDLLVEWGIANATTPTCELLHGVLSLWMANPPGTASASQCTQADHLLAYVEPRLLTLDAEARAFVRIDMRAGGVLLKQLWGDLDDNTSMPSSEVWEMLYKLTCAYLDSCITSAYPQTDLLQNTYESTREQHIGMYQSTMFGIKLSPNFAKYSSTISEVDRRVTARNAHQMRTQQSDDLWCVYRDARAIQGRYERFMALLSEKTGCDYTIGKRKNPYRAIEKIGLALHQWLASKVKDIVRGAQVMPDIGKGYQLLELMVACDPSEAADSAKRGWYANAGGITEQICIVDVKNRWVTATSGGWSDVLITFYFTDDPTKHVCEVQLVHSDMMRVRKKMGAHAGYTMFRCALELLEATDHADLIVENEARSMVDDVNVDVDVNGGGDLAAEQHATESSGSTTTAAAALIALAAKFEASEARSEARHQANEARFEAYEVQIKALKQEIIDLSTGAGFKSVGLQNP